MTADATLMAILTGGVYKAESVGIDGITRDATPSAFSGGYLRPSALVKQRAMIPTGDVLDPMEQDTSMRQVVEIWLYADSGAGYTAIDSAYDRIFALFQGYQFSDSSEIFLVNVIDRMRDEGALKGASLARMDFEVFSIKG
jgi:hypothetical protein